LCDFGSATTHILPARSANFSISKAELDVIHEDVQKHTTLQYRAPELCDVYMGKGINEKVDIWALGVMLYKLCYYITPFEKEGINAIMNSRYQYPVEPRFSSNLLALIKWCLQEEPTRRPTIYQLVSEVCRLRNIACPIENIYPEVHSESAATGSDIARNDNQNSAMSMISNRMVRAPMILPQTSQPLQAMRRGRIGKSSSNLGDGDKPIPNDPPRITAVPDRILDISTASPLPLNSLKERAAPISAKSPIFDPTFPAFEDVINGKSTFSGSGSNLRQYMASPASANAPEYNIDAGLSKSSLSASTSDFSYPFPSSPQVLNPHLDTKSVNSNAGVHSNHISPLVSSEALNGKFSSEQPQAYTKVFDVDSPKPSSQFFQNLDQMMFPPQQSNAPLSNSINKPTVPMKTTSLQSRQLDSSKLSRSNLSRFHNHTQRNQWVQNYFSSAVFKRKYVIRIISEMLRCFTVQSPPIAWWSDRLKLPGLLVNTSGVKSVMLSLRALYLYHITLRHSPADLISHYRSDLPESYQARWRTHFSPSEKFVYLYSGHLVRLIRFHQLFPGKLHGSLFADQSFSTSQMIELIQSLKDNVLFPLSDLSIVMYENPADLKEVNCPEIQMVLLNMLEEVFSFHALYMHFLTRLNEESPLDIRIQSHLTSLDALSQLLGHFVSSVQRSSSGLVDFNFPSVRPVFIVRLL
jgi:serine/threonine protein kinase